LTLTSDSNGTTTYLPSFRIRFGTLAICVSDSDFRFGLNLCVRFKFSLSDQIVRIWANSLISADSAS